MATKCPTITKEGEPCRGTPLPGRVYCLSHDPERKEAQREASRKGGEGKAKARRDAKAWAAIGREMRADDYPAILQACAISVRDGEMTPGQAGAIATVLKTAQQITQANELEERIRELEEAVNITPHNLRRIS